MRALASIRAVVPSFLALAALSVSPRASASPEDIFSYGTRAPAMGGVGAASSTGFESAYTNPALLSMLRKNKLTLGLASATFDLHADGAGLPGRVSVPPMKGIVIGAEMPIPFGGILKDKVGLALAFYTPTDVIVRGKILYPETAQFPILADRAQSLAVRLGFGVDVGHGLRLGVGFAALAEIDGTVLVATDATGRVGSRVEDQLVATYAPILGATFDLPLASESSESSKWRVGATYRGKLDARFAVSIDATKLSSLKLPVFNIAGLAQFDPAQLALEVAREAGPWTLALGATYKMWSKYPGPLEPTILCPSDNPDCGAPEPTRVSFNDTVVVRAGAERALVLGRGAKAFFRGGLFFEPTPVARNLPASYAFDPGGAARCNASGDPACDPRQALETRFFDGNRYVFTIGGGVELGDPLPPITIDTWAQYHLLSRSFDLAPSGHADVSGHVLAIGLAAGVTF
jgi:hypothetical protein